MGDRPQSGHGTHAPATRAGAGRADCLAAIASVILLAGCGADRRQDAAGDRADVPAVAARAGQAPSGPASPRSTGSGPDGSDQTATDPSAFDPTALDPPLFDRTSIAPEDKPRPARTPDVVYVPTPQPVVDAMLEIAAVGPDDVLYDLGSGDGRIPITAAKRWGTRGVGIEIHPLRIREANLAAHRAGVADRVTFIEADLFEIDLSSATVITLYLLPDLNLRLRPRLLRLAPGTRIVTHNYHMGDWVPQRQRVIGDSVIYYWTVPEEIPPHLR